MHTYELLVKGKVHLFYKQVSTASHGDTVQLTDGNGNIVWNYAYDAFGNQKETVNSGTEPYNPFRYTGEYFDAETGFIYLRARYMNPETGRFISEDPACDGINWYAYAGGNPVRYYDPSGYSFEDSIAGIITALDEGALANVVSCLLEITGKDMDSYVAESFSDYYLGRLIGDTLCMAINAGTAVVSAKGIIDSIATGASITVSSGGVLTAGGVSIAAAGVAAGTVVMTGAISLELVASKNFTDDLGKFNSSLDNNASNTVQKSHVKVNQGQQDKHIPGTNNYKVELQKGQNRSILEANPQELLDNYAGKGVRLSESRERVNFGKIIGQYYDRATNTYIPTTNGIIHYKANGTAHIVPAKP